MLEMAPRERQKPFHFLNTSDGKQILIPILHTPLCCSASNQHKAQLTKTKKDGGRELKKGMHFLFLE